MPYLWRIARKKSEKLQVVVAWMEDKAISCHSPNKTDASPPLRLMKNSGKSQKLDFSRPVHGAPGSLSAASVAKEWALIAREDQFTERLGVLLREPSAREAMKLTSSKTQRRLLNIGARRVETDCMRLLLEAGIDAKLPVGRHGLSALMIAIFDENAPMWEMLLPVSDTEHKTPRGGTALLAACRQNTPQIELVRALLPKQNSQAKPRRSSATLLPISCPMAILFGGSGSLELLKAILPHSEVFGVDESNKRGLLDQLVDSGSRPHLAAVAEEMKKRDAFLAEKTVRELALKTCEAVAQRDALGPSSLPRFWERHRAQAIDWLCEMGLLPQLTQEHCAREMSKFGLSMPFVQAMMEREELRRTAEIKKKPPDAPSVGQQDGFGAAKGRSAPRL